MGALQPWHLIVVLVIVLVIFGPGKIPELGKSLGDGMRELKKATSEDGSSQGTTATTLVVPLCTKCQSPLTATDKFCGSCGTVVAQAPPATAATH